VVFARDLTLPNVKCIILFIGAGSINNALENGKSQVLVTFFHLAQEFNCGVESELGVKEQS
jgi:hypothetical protein